MLLGMIKPTQGTVLLFGNNVGYLVETTHSYPNLTVRENLEVYLHLRKLTDNKLIDNVIERLKLSDYRNTKAKYLSLGNLQRLGLAKALMHEPKLLILDEPMNGLDPAGIIEIRQILVELSKRGTTIFISSHILSEIAKLATKIGIIHKGRLIKELESEQLEQQVLKKLIVETRDNMKAVELLNNSIFSSINDEGMIEIYDYKAISNPEIICKGWLMPVCLQEPYMFLKRIWNPSS
ncbi:ABC transporter ATP-binding protein [Thermosediminibacter oceani]|uniref:ABC transporter ATP-binding protein n=1 Tax=Thermosediminibacter oceani TaxID=291990 RepID=UPI001FE01B3D